MKSKSVSKSIFAVILAVALMISACPIFSFAAQIIDEEQKLSYLYTFNHAVNSIKTKKPAFKYQKESGMNKENDIYIGSSSSADLSTEAYRYLSVIVDAFFNPDKGLVKNLIAVISGNETPYVEKEIIKGTDTKYFLPAYGEDYVSALTTDDDCTLFVEEKTDRLDPSRNTTTIQYAFPECDLENVKDSAIGKVFDLPSGSIDPVVIGGGTLADSEGPLSEVKFQDFKFHNAYVRAVLDADGELTKYIQNISYTFSLSFYDMLRVFSAFAKVDLMEIGLAIANTILVNTGNPEVTARELLKDSVMYIQYDIRTELSSFDWVPREFGDIDNDGAVTAVDARLALRNSVSLEKFDNQEALIYGDVDFDGLMTAADARLILRMAVSLENRFTDVPEGKTIKIVIIGPEKDDESESPDTPADPENPENPDTPDNPNLPTTGDVADGVTDFVNAIFDVVNGIKGDEVSSEGISGLIQQIKDIVAYAKGDKNTSENENTEKV